MGRHRRHRHGGPHRGDARRGPSLGIQIPADTATATEPQEGAGQDRTDGELGQLAKTIGADPSVVACVKSGDDVGTAKAKAANGYSTLSGDNADATPFVWDGARSVNYQDPAWLTRLIG